MNNINYKKFLISDILELKNKEEIKKYGSIPKNEGEYPFISSKETNNGIATYCDIIPQISNCITISTNGKGLKCFYHEYGIVPSQDVEVAVLKNNKELTPEIACYLIACIEKHKYKFNHSFKPKDGRFLPLEIYLPITSKGEIDWDYMTQYIKEIEAYLTVAKLDNVTLTERERDASWISKK